MDSMGTKGQPVVRKAKKKQVKDELDRQKQAEKKKRRLEKALATSAAIISELEKKKQQKKEEQQRLDEEGAAIAEAVALHVLLGEDSDDCKIVLNEHEGLNAWDCPGKFDLFKGHWRPGSPHQDSRRYSLEGITWVSNLRSSGGKKSSLLNDDWSFSSFPFRSLCFEDGWDSSKISAGAIAAQAVSSLQIAEDVPEDSIAFSRMLRG